MAKRIENLRWKPMWVSHVGCLKGALEYLKMDVSAAWLFGATGHAFIINMHEVVCPSGPTAWKTERFMKLGSNIGYSIEGVWGFKSDPDFSKKQKSAWDTAKSAIDEGMPCYGWELDVPEYYIINGYDDQGYYFSGPQVGSPHVEGRKPWNELGNTDIGVLEMYTVRPGQPADDATAVKEAFQFALEHGKSPEKWIFPKYKAGLAGFDAWIQALEKGEAHAWGMAYNSAVWHECRQFAVEFLEEARGRLDAKVSSLFEEAAGYYEAVAQNLKGVTEAFPFPPKGDEVKDMDRCKTAAGYLRGAKEAEERGLRALEQIASQL